MDCAECSSVGGKLRASGEAESWEGHKQAADEDGWKWKWYVNAT